LPHIWAPFIWGKDPKYSKANRPLSHKPPKSKVGPKALIYFIYKISFLQNKNWGKMIFYSAKKNSKYFLGKKVLEKS
jgi:hypothetical protein